MVEGDSTHLIGRLFFPGNSQSLRRTETEGIRLHQQKSTDRRKSSFLEIPWSFDQRQIHFFHLIKKLFDLWTIWQMMTNVKI
jgi:hypothetical protein